MVLTKVRNGKEKTVIIGKDLIVKKLDGSPEVKGEFNGFANGSIIVGADTIAIDKILQLIKPYEWRIAGMIVAVPVVIFGVAYAGISALILTAGAIYNDNVMVIGGSIDLLIGAAIVYFGLYPYTHKGRKFKIGKKWKIEMPVETETEYYAPQGQD